MAFDKPLKSIKQGYGNVKMGIWKYRKLQGSDRTRQIFGSSIQRKILILFVILLVFAAVIVGINYIKKNKIGKDSSGETEEEKNLNQNSDISGCPVCQECLCPLCPVYEKQEAVIDPEMLRQGEITNSNNFNIPPNEFSTSCLATLKMKEEDMQDAKSLFVKARNKYKLKLAELEREKRTLEAQIKNLQLEEEEFLAVMDKCSSGWSPALEAAENETTNIADTSTTEENS